MLRFGYLGTVLRTMDLIRQASILLPGPSFEVTFLSITSPVMLASKRVYIFSMMDTGAYKCSKASQDSTIKKKCVIIELKRISHSG